MGPSCVQWVESGDFPLIIQNDCTYIRKTHNIMAKFDKKKYSQPKTDTNPFSSVGKVSP